MHVKASDGRVDDKGEAGGRRPLTRAYARAAPRARGLLQSETHAPDTVLEEQFLNNIRNLQEYITMIR